MLCFFLKIFYTLLIANLDFFTTMNCRRLIMSYNDFLGKIRQLDNITAKWMMRHFYFMFFQLVLVVVFFFWLFNTMQVIDTNFRHDFTSITEKLMMNQTVSLTVVTFLILLNSFWLLYIFSSMQRMTTILKDVSFHISRLRTKK